MKKKVLGIVTTLLAGAGLAHGQDRMVQPAAAVLVPPGRTTSAYGENAPAAPQQGMTLPGYPAQPGYSVQPAPVSADGGSYAAAPACGGGCQESCGWKVHGWLGADYLMWFPQGQSLRPALVRGPGAAAPGPVLVGGNAGAGYGMESGFRIITGVWLDSEDRKGAQTESNNLFRASNTIVAPAGSFLNLTVGGVPTPIQVTAPGLTYNTYTSFWSNDADTILRLRCSEHTKVYGLFGLKTGGLEEDINFRYNVVGAGGAFLDEFHTRNTFWGGEAGVKITHFSGSWGIDATAKLALGANYASISVLGSNNANLPTQAFTNDANIGYFENTVFSIIPEGEANLYYKLTDNIKLRVGYTFMYYTNVIRPGPQVTGVIAPGLLSPHTQPAFVFSRSDFTIHGLNFGATWKY